MRKILAITNALADGSRIRTLLALRRGRLCVTQIADLLQLAPSTVSKHLSILRQADLVDSRKEDRWVYYALSKSPDLIVRQALEWILGSAANTPLIIEDVQRLKDILRENPEKLRRRQKT